MHYATLLHFVIYTQEESVKFLKMMLSISITLCLTIGLTAAADAKSIVFVSIVPQKYFVKQIAGDLVNVEVLVSPGANPHMYEPTPSQMVALAQAKAYFTIGIKLEEVWLPRITDAAPSLRFVHTEHGIKKIPMAAHGEHDNDKHEEHDDHEMHADEHEHEDHHGHEAQKEHDEHGAHAKGHHEEAHDKHDHGTLDPHIWLDPVRVQTIARNTCQGLIEADPQNQNIYEANLKAFLADIDNTQHDIEKIISKVPSGDRSFLVFHPSWGYFANRYGLQQLSIEVEGREPSPKALAEIIKHARNEGSKVIFVQPQISHKTAKVIAGEIGAVVKVLDPLAADWKGNLMKAARAFKDIH